MALRIVKASEPITVNRINICIYAPPGVGKTTLAQTAEDPLTLDFDKGIYRASNRKDSVTISSWKDAAELTADDLAPYKTIVVDTAGRALDFLSADIIAENPKAGRSDGSLTLQGFGTLKTRFGTWLKKLNMFGKDVVLVAHMDEQRNGDDVIERLDVQGGSKGEIYKSVDAMGRIFIRNKQRVIDFSPRENAFGKNPAGLEVLTIPDTAKDGHFLASVIADIKAKINTLSVEQQEAQRVLEDWAELISQLEDVDDFNRNTGIRQAPKAAQEMFKARAAKLGFVADKKLGQYINPKEAAHAS
jgi:hypothetical protein